MPSEGGFAFGVVVLVPFPFTDQSTVKRRPAVVISSHSYNQVRPDLLMMPITSQLRPSADRGEVWIEDWQEAGLLKPSAVKPAIATFEQGLVLRRLGALTRGDEARLRAAINQIIG